MEESTKELENKKAVREIPRPEMKRPRAASGLPTALNSIYVFSDQLPGGRQTPA
jgi:hypothetical protein